MPRIYRRDFSSGLQWILGLFILQISFLTVVRLAFLFIFQGEHLKNVQLLDIVQAFVTGFRFDAMVSGYILLPALMLLIFLRLISNEERSKLFFAKFCSIYGASVITLLLFVSLIDLYYYAYFQNHFNILFFGIIDDDTRAVLSGIWNDYPVLRIFAAMLLLYWLIFRLTGRIVSKEKVIPSMKWFYETGSLVLILGLFVLALRGSTGLFPLHYEDSIISENTFVNNLAINGVFALKNAVTEKTRQSIDDNIAQSLNKYQYHGPEEALSDYLQIKVDSADPQKLITSTEEDSLLKADPPNVVFIQMESFSNYYLDLHNDTFNLLGRLETQLPHCVVFRNFLSATSGTIHSLEALLTGSPLTPLSQSIYMDCPLQSSVAARYASCGYHTSFITSGALGWRNMDKFTHHQGFELAEGSEVLLKKIPGTERCDWGVFDESMFARALEVLRTKDGKPHFVYLLTTTNHPPFQLPSHYKPLPLKVSPTLRQRLKVEYGMAIDNFANYQYATDCLGAFIEAIRNSEIGANTIVAASGDHNTLQVFNFEDTRLLAKHSVPFIIYIPDKYKKFRNPDTSVFGSHKDVFPTLMSVSLSSANYLKTGVNLLDSKQAADNFAIINYSLCMDRHGVVRFEHQPVFFEWSNQSAGMNIMSNQEVDKPLHELLTKARAYCASMCYFIQSDLKRCKKG
ncbi:MAG: sulfatase-like hydrolase/transferase [Saprospiraceae bacterium]